MKVSGLIIGAAFLLSPYSVSSQIRGHDQDMLKEKIITKTWKAMFGDLSRENLHTIYYESYFHGREIPGKIYIKLPDQFRNESEDITLIFDGKHAAIIDQSIAEKDESGGLELVDSVFLSHFEVDIAMAFPAFFEYPSQYMGKVRLGNAECWQLYVELPRGGHVSYFIDTTSHLVIRRLVSWDGDPDLEPWENIISGYHDYNGILFERGYSFTGHEGREEGFYRNAQFNMDLDAGLFRIPVKLFPE